LIVTLCFKIQFLTIASLEKCLEKALKFGSLKNEQHLSATVVRYLLLVSYIRIIKNKNNKRKKRSKTRLRPRKLQKSYQIFVRITKKMYKLQAIKREQS